MFIKVRPALLSQGSLESVINVDQAGRLEDDNPDTDAITLGGSVDVLANDFGSGNSHRRIYRFAESFDIFQGLMIATGLAVIDARDHKLKIDFITDSDLDLNNVTFNNQGSLTFEDISEFNPWQHIILSASPFSQIEKGVIDKTFSGFHTVDGFVLPSTDPIFGMRIAVVGDTAYSGDEEVIATAGSPVIFGGVLTP